MSSIAQVLILLSTLTLWMPFLAQSGDINGPAPLILSDAQAKYQLGQHMEILEDPSGKLTIQEVSSPAYADQYEPGQSKSPTFGYSASTYWIRFQLYNESKSTDHWLLEVDFANMHYVDLYLPSPEGEGYITKQSGVLRPFNTRDIAYNRIVFDLPLAPNEEQTFYMRFQSGASMTLPLTLWFPEAFFQAGVQERLILGIFYGVLLIILIYHLSCYFRCGKQVTCTMSVSWRVQSYSSFHTTLLPTNISGDDQFASINHSVPLFFILSLASITWFTDAFLEIKTRNPKLHRLIAFGDGRLGNCPPAPAYRQLSCYLQPDSSLRRGLDGTGWCCRSDFLARRIPACQILLVSLVGFAFRGGYSNLGPPWRSTEHNFHRAVSPRGDHLVGSVLGNCPGRPR